MRNLLKFKVLSVIILLLSITYMEVFSQKEEPGCCAKLMETVSVLTGTSLFQIYLNISMMNDNVDYTENYEIFDNALFSLDKQLETISEHLTTFNKFKVLKKEDFEYIFQLKEINFLLKEDISYFRSFLESGEDSVYKQFFLNHNKVYLKLDELLDLESEEIEDSGE